MEATEWAAVSAFASAVSAIVALVLSLYTGRAAAAQIRGSDFNNCLELVCQLGEAQRKVRDAADESIKLFELRELLNLLEALALLINDRKIPPSTRKIAEHFLIEVWAWSKANPDMQALFKHAVTASTTFAALITFAERNQPKINSLVEAYAEQISASSNS